MSLLDYKKYKHRNKLSVYLAVLVAVGGGSRKSEILEDESWTAITDLPVNGADDGFGNYAVIYHTGHHYYFGGSVNYGHKELNSILRLTPGETTWTWSNLGKMKSARQDHAVILFGDTFMIVGGGGTRSNEACILKNGNFSCAEFTSSLDGYAYWPILLLVDNDYGNC